MKINKEFLKQAGIFLLFLIGFWAISAMFLKPALDDKVMAQSDMQQFRLLTYAPNQYKEATGHFPGWSDGVFSGMPTSLITGIPNGNLVHLSGLFELFHFVKTPINFLFVAMLGMFVLLLSCNVNRWLAAAGAVGYAFMTFSITSYEAGHITKVLAMAVLPGFIGGLLLLNQRKYLWGAAVTGSFFAAIVGYFHYQIAYYAGMMAAVYMLIVVIKSIRLKDTKHALIMAGVSVAMLAAGALSSAGKIVDTAQYAEATMRGGSEVASETPKKGPQKPDANKKGLEMDYAFRWSYGIGETFTLMIPNFKGGGSAMQVSEEQASSVSEEFIKVVDQNLGGRVPFYFGDLPSTSGPVYIGAIFIFLFFLGIFTVIGLNKFQPDDNSLAMAKGIMWFAIISTVISILLSWGRFFFINEFLFNYLPYYNKFRTPMMALTIAQVSVPFFGLYGLHLFINQIQENTTKKWILKRAAITIGSLFALAAIMVMVNGVSSEIIGQLKKNNLRQSAEDLISLRSGVVWSDWTRSLVLVALALGTIYFFVVRNKTVIAVYGIMLALVSFDLIGVASRFVNDDNWKEKETEESIVPSEADNAVMKIDKKNSRVFDLRIDPFNDNHSAPWHRNIGGYHPAKISRYQDIISYGITPNGGSISYEGLMKNNALDMLNCKYIISKSQDGKEKEQVIPRTTNLGNAWFVKKVLVAKDAKEALDLLNHCKIGEEAVLESKEKLKPASNEFVLDSNAKIEIAHYSLDTIDYVSNNSNAGLGVFSEVYYNQKNALWRAKIDGKETPVLRLNYILRALEIPAGKHKIEFIFDFNSNRYLWLEKTSSGIILFLVFLSFIGSALGLKFAGNKND